MKNLFCNIIGSYKHIPYTWKHYLVFRKIEKKLLGRNKYKFHDLDKLFLFIFFPWLGVGKINKIHRKIRIMKQKKYILVQWPESQYLMENPRFSECIFCIDIDGHSEVGSSAYMCPEDLWNEIFVESCI
jgi:hypothetical protein